MYMRTMKRSILYYLILTEMCCIILYLHGFFPMNKHDDSTATKKNLPDSIDSYRINKSELYKPSIGRMVILVIDALRWDFVGRNNMPYTASLLNSNKGCLFKGKSGPPTVTMPRIKAMTTGTVPNFVDVALNLGSSKILDDNLLLQAQRNGKKIIFYGDETWLKLFPHTFARSEGTTSFFVSDFTEVDDNVTRHLPAELNAHDWDIMILHYLGLDHIGHVEGPLSPLVKPKLQEMDHVVKQIHDNFEIWDREHVLPSLLLVCGDHGMKNSGSHGGASLEEILVPLVFLSQVCVGNQSRDTTDHLIPQIDLVPTLSILLGLPIPSASLGKLIPDLLQHMDVTRQLYTLYYNSKQVAAQFENNIASASSHESYMLYQEAVKLHVRWLTSPHYQLGERAATMYLTALDGMSSLLADSLVSFDVPSLVVASGILWQLVLILVLEVNLTRVRLMFVLCMNIILLSFAGIWCSYNCSTSLLCKFLPATFITITVVVFNTYLISGGMLPKTSFIQMLSTEHSQVVLTLGLFLQLISLASSSFIEEEHQVWYFMWMTFLLVVCYKFLCDRRVEWILLLPFVHRVLRKWNHTGDKWASLPDIGDWLVQQEHKTSLTVTFCSGLVAVCWCCSHISRRHSDTYYARIIEKAMYIAAGICVFCYRCAIGNIHLPFAYPHSRGIKEVRAFWSVITLLLAMGLGEALYQRHRSLLQALRHLLRTLTCCWLLLCTLLHRPHDVLLIAVQVLMCECVYACHKSTWWLVVVHTFIANVIYFYQGNSNSLASIDVASGYVGQTEYNPVIVAVLLLANTYCAPVLSYLLLVIKLVQNNNSESLQEKLLSAHHCYILLRLLPVALFTVLLILLRYHLFVWTVFSPKFLYEAVNTFIISVLVIFTELLVRVVQT